MSKEDWPQSYKLFATKDLHMFCPLLYIIDPQDRPRKLSKSSNLLGILEASPELNNFYFRKYRPGYIWYGDQFEEQSRMFLESYFEGTAKMDFRTEERRRENTRVKEITTDEFR